MSLSSSLHANQHVHPSRSPKGLHYLSRAPLPFIQMLATPAGSYKFSTPEFLLVNSQTLLALVFCCAQRMPLEEICCLTCGKWQHQQISWRGERKRHDFNFMQCLGLDFGTGSSRQNAQKGQIWTMLPLAHLLSYSGFLIASSANRLEPWSILCAFCCLLACEGHPPVRHLISL